MGHLLLMRDFTSLIDRELFTVVKINRLSGQLNAAIAKQVCKPNSFKWSIVTGADHIHKLTAFKESDLKSNKMIKNGRKLE